jgi:hypothetical protein
MKFIFKTARKRTDEQKWRTVTPPRPAATQPVVLKTVAKFRARAETDSSEEKRDSKFAKGEIGVGGHVPDLSADATDAAKDERDNKGLREAESIAAAGPEQRWAWCRARRRGQCQ